MCALCHFAYDSGEWIFVPEEAAAWSQSIKAAPDVITKYRNKRTVLHRRILLDEEPIDPSLAFQDPHFRSAFDKAPTKYWAGEPGLVIVRDYPTPVDPSPALEEVLETFQELKKLWFKYESQGSIDDCPLCSPHINEDVDKDQDLSGEDEGERIVKTMKLIMMTTKVKMQTQRMKAMKTRKTMMMTRVTRTNIEVMKTMKRTLGRTDMVMSPVGEAQEGSRRGN